FHFCPVEVVCTVVRMIPAQPIIVVVPDQELFRKFSEAHADIHPTQPELMIFWYWIGCITTEFLDQAFSEHHCRMRQRCFNEAFHKMLLRRYDPVLPLHEPAHTTVLFYGRSEIGLCSNHS